METTESHTKGRTDMRRAGFTVSAIAPFTDYLVCLEVSEILNGLIAWCSKASGDSHELFRTDESQLSIRKITVCWIDAPSFHAVRPISCRSHTLNQDTYARKGAARDVPLELCKKYWFMRIGR